MHLQSDDFDLIIINVVSEKNNHPDFSKIMRPNNWEIVFNILLTIIRPLAMKERDRVCKYV